MSALSNRSTNIVRDKTQDYVTSCGFVEDGIASDWHSREGLWKQAIDEMLAWRAGSELFEPDDVPDQEILDTAIDYAMDQIRERGPVPSSIIPSGSGRIAMEWNDRDSTVVIEFVALGVATYTLFDCGKRRHKLYLFRDPASRKLELRG